MPEDDIAGQVDVLVERQPCPGLPQQLGQRGLAPSSGLNRRSIPVADCGGKPLRLTDNQPNAFMRAAEPLAVGDRDAFLRDMAAALQGQELGDGAVYRVIAQIQRRHYDPPIMTAARRWGR